LYYITGVTFVCLMIEVSKRRADLLDTKLYVVQTAKESELATVPSLSLDEKLSDDDEVIPRRNRGRGSPDERKERRKSSVNDDENEVEQHGSDKEKFREWKSSLKISPGEAGLFKKWKQAQGLTKKQKKTVDEDEYTNEDVNVAIVEEEGVGEEEDEQIVDDGENYTKQESNDDPEETTEREIHDTKPGRKAAKPRTAAKPRVEPKDRSEPKPQTDAKERKERKQWKGDAIVDKESDDYEEVSAEDVVDIDYPGGITEYESPAPLHNCMNFTLTDEFLERSKKVERSCSRFEDEVGSQRRLYSRLRWAVPERLLYCPVFKAASTSWLSNYLKLVNSTANPKSGNLHKTVTNLFPPPATFKLRRKIYEESIKFIIVRHPFERLVSAYRDKLAGFSRNDHYLTMRSHIISKYRKNVKDKSTIPTFSESVDFILDELIKIDSPSRDRHSLIDGHFIPYSRRCLPCAMDYDLIIKFETLEEDSRYLIDQCGLSEQLDVRHENRAPSGPRTKQGFKNKSKKVKKGEEDPKDSNGSSFQSLDFFKDIPVSKIKRLYEHYRHDFEIFDYSADEYFNRL